MIHTRKIRHALTISGDRDFVLKYTEKDYMLQDLMLHNSRKEKSGEMMINITNFIFSWKTRIIFTKISLAHVQEFPDYARSTYSSSQDKMFSCVS